ncbi:MAG: hypothetical protein M1838_003912 [Thelocarpon superellum]|nr:MAG: hypothetical protein M1838_003912 [Thelocarpon superellum]
MDAQDETAKDTTDSRQHGADSLADTRPANATATATAKDHQAEKEPIPSSSPRRRSHDVEEGLGGEKALDENKTNGSETEKGQDEDESTKDEPKPSDHGEDHAYQVGWDGDEDPQNPRSMHTARKWVVVFLVAMSSLCVTCTSSIYTFTYDQIDVEFGVSRIVATLGLSLFVVGLGVGPLVLAPLSEVRRVVEYKTLAHLQTNIKMNIKMNVKMNIKMTIMDDETLALFFIWIIPSAVATNIQTMLIARFLDGVAGSTFLSVAGGTVGDMFNKDELQAPMMIYTSSPFLGPVIGPAIGGAINQFANWRWTFYVLLIWSGVLWIATVLFVPETYHPVLLHRKAIRLRRETGNAEWYAPIEKHDRSIPKTIAWSLIRPFELLIFEPMCLNLCLYSALILGILYLFFGAFGLIFENHYHFELFQVGLSFIGMLVGMFIAIATVPLFGRHRQYLVAQREAAGGEHGGSEPEFRLPPAMVGGVLIPVGLFWFAWTVDPSIPWIVPIIGSAFFGMGTVLIFSGIFTFLVDAYPLYAASALAANSFARSAFAAAFPLFGLQMYEKLGYAWASSLLAFLTLAMTPFP